MVFGKRKFREHVGFINHQIMSTCLRITTVAYVSRLCSPFCFSLAPPLNQNFHFLYYKSTMTGGTMPSWLLPSLPLLPCLYRVPLPHARSAAPHLPLNRRRPSHASVSSGAALRCVRLLRRQKAHPLHSGGSNLRTMTSSTRARRGHLLPVGLQSRQIAMPGSFLLNERIGGPNRS
jgi:hypothetical protein